MKQQPSFSIILAVHNQASDISTNLPLLLTQQYDGTYQVIVVDQKSSDETTDVLDALKAEHPLLYTTFLPHYHFQSNPRRMALTIGVKAAAGHWTIFADISKPVPGESWLQELSACCSDHTDLLLGYISTKDGSVQLQTYDSIGQASAVISRAERWRAGVGGNRWMHRLQKSTAYDFIVVKTNLAHQLLRLFAVNTLGHTTKL